MTSDYEDFRFERPGTLDLVFRGRVIATADSRDNTRKIPKDRPRWTEIVIYLTDSNKWIVLNAGCSDVPGETDKEAGERVRLFAGAWSEWELVFGR